MSGRLGAAWGTWTRFWFEPVSTSTLALVRVGFGLVLTGWTLSLAADLRAFFGPGGSLAAPPSAPWRWGLLHVANTDAAVVALWTLLLVSAVALTGGAGTRVAAVVAWVAVLSLQRRNPYVFNSGDVLVRQLSFLLALAPAGAALSVDRFVRHRDRFLDHPRRAAWPVRLIQLNLAFGYVVSVSAKLSGETWTGGTAVGYVLRIGDLQRFAVPDLLLDQPVVVTLLTWGALATELAVAVLVWNRRLRPVVLLLGAVMHVAIDLTIEVGFFSYAVLVSYLAFVPPEAADRAIAWVSDRFRRSATSVRAATDCT
ncbi:MAG: HTTM domain-containing protein [Actinobacteria bacterium]|nr:HTTM domain-containing protein [Actinomycetota bacterium]